MNSTRSSSVEPIAGPGRWVSDDMVCQLAGAVDWPDLGGDRYEVIEALGRGGMGTVYRALDRELDREVAIKVLRHHRADSTDAARMLREAKVTARLEHPGIVPVHDVGTLTDGRTYYVMKLVRGNRLDEHVRAPGSLHDRLRMLERVCETAAFAHARNLVHRDLKPQNIMIGPFGEILVLDWGVAKILRSDASTPSAPIELEPTSKDSGPSGYGTRRIDSMSPVVVDDTQTRATAAGTIIGTLAYMAPEQARGDIAATDARADVYALGAILSWLRRQAEAEPEMGRASAQFASSAFGWGSWSRRRSQRMLESIEAKAMSQNPADRYPDAAAMGRDLLNYLNGQPVTSYREAWLERAIGFLGRYRFFIEIILAYLVMRWALLKWLGR